MTERELLKDKKRIVIKIGSSSLTHAETGDLNLAKIEKLVRIISDMSISSLENACPPMLTIMKCFQLNDSGLIFVCKVLSAKVRID